MSDGLISIEWLESIGYVREKLTNAGWSKDFGEGHILQLVPHDGKWIVELWNVTPAGRMGAVFRQLFTRQSELQLVMSFMEDPPF